MGRRRRALAVTTVTVAATMTAAAPALAGGPGESPDIRVVTSGLDGPRQLSFVDRHRLVVAESDTGEITQVKLLMGGKRTLVRGLVVPQGVDEQNGRLFIATGEGGGPPVPGAPPAPPIPGATSLLKVPYFGGTPRVVSDLLKFELRDNPDGQLQFDEAGSPPDTLANPFAVLAGPRSVLVADGGANAVLRYDRTSGRVTPFFVPPVITTGACEGRPNNDPGTTGCDSVPTGLARHGGAVYVSTEGGGAAGSARVYKVDERTGATLQEWGDLTGVTGIAVSHDDGSVYVSELLFGAPMGDGPPPPGFDPATVGRIVRIAPDGTRTTAQVTMPTGLAWHDGRLYTSAWSVAGLFLGIPHAGQIVSVSPHAFR